MVTPSNYGPAQPIYDSFQKILANPIAAAIWHMLGMGQNAGNAPQSMPAQPAGALPNAWEKANQESVQQMLHQTQQKPARKP